jgi:hypothetical protein
MRFLHRSWPEVDVAELGEAAVEAEHLGVGPGADDQLLGFVIPITQGCRDHPVGEVGIGAGAHGKTGDDASAAETVEHAQLLGDSDRRVVQGDRVAQDDDGNVPRSPGQRRCHEVG